MTMAPIRPTAAAPVPGMLIRTGLLLSVLAAAAPAAPALHAQATGSIEGVVSLREQPARRTLNRYAGSGNAAARSLQDVPVVAYLEGAFPGAAAPRPGAAEIAQRDTAFAPAVLVVPVGTTVAFPNRDPFFHNVFSYSPTKRFDLGRYSRGESKSVLFDRAGVSKVYCEVHQFMRSAVVVVENPHYAVVGADGRFMLRNVPAGEHRLVVWDIERRPQELMVTVPAGGAARVQVTLQ
jgi:plastocyanin